MTKVETVRCLCGREFVMLVQIAAAFRVAGQPFRCLSCIIGWRYQTRVKTAGEKRVGKR
jgi:hypothetical protein